MTRAQRARDQVVADLSAQVARAIVVDSDTMDEFVRQVHAEKVRIDCLDLVLRSIPSPGTPSAVIETAAELECYVINGYVKPVEPAEDQALFAGDDADFDALSKYQGTPGQVRP